MPLTRKRAAEFIGTFWLVLGGCGSAVLAAAFPHVGIGLMGVALAFGQSRAAPARRYSFKDRRCRSSESSGSRP